MHFAARNGHSEAVEFLLSKDAQIEAEDMFTMTPLMDAARHGHLAVVKLLLNNGAEVNRRNETRSNALHYAAIGNNLEVVRCLIKMGADSYNINCNNETPLDCAQRLKMKDIMGTNTSNRFACVHYLSLL